jgi:hypothetical protein
MPEEVGAEQVDDELEPAVQRGEDQRLLLVGIELGRQRRGGPVAAHDGRDLGVPGPELRGRAEPGQQPRDVVAAPEHGVLVGGPVLLGRSRPLAAAGVERGAVLGEEPDVVDAAPTPDRMDEQRALGGVGAGREQEPDVLRTLMVERVRERPRPARLRAVLEQQAQARRVLGLDRVIQRVAELGLAVRVGAVLEQRAGELHAREARVADVVKRRPAPRPARLVRVSVPAAAEHEPRPAVAGDLRPRLQEPARASAPARRRGGHERGHARVHAVHERRPAREPVLARDHELRAREAHRQIAEPVHRLRVPGPCRTDELLGLLAKLLEIHVALLP